MFEKLLWVVYMEFNMAALLLLVLLLLYMSIIMVALSHYCCRTTLQCQCHVSQAKEQSQYLSATVQRNTRHVRESIHRETLPKQHSFQFLAEGDQSRCIPDMSRQRVPGSCCSRREARSPSVERRVDGTSSVDVSANRRWRVAQLEAGWMVSAR